MGANMKDKEKEISKKESYEKPELKKEGSLRDVTANDSGMTQIDPPSQQL